MSRKHLRKLWIALTAIAALAFPQAVEVIDRATDVLKAGLEEAVVLSQMDSTSSDDDEQVASRR